MKVTNRNVQVAIQNGMRPDVALHVWGTEVGGGDGGTITYPPPPGPTAKGPITYVLICRDCSPEASLDPLNLVGDMPFPSAEARGKWAKEHKDATGHDRWIVIDG